LPVRGSSGTPGRLQNADQLVALIGWYDRTSRMTESRDSAPPAPDGVDLTKPSAARMYDWYLGGTHNWAVDREFGKKAVELFPLTKNVARQNRQVMNRIVRSALAAGIRQFLDLGSGVPTVGNVHEVVRGHLPAGERASVVYVDYEPVAAAHGTVVLEQDDATDWAGLVQADMRTVEAVLEDPTTRRLIDFEQPVCLLMIAVLHFVGEDDQPAEIVRHYQEKLAPGSWLAISHITNEKAAGEQAEQMHRFVKAYENTSNPVWLRNSSELAQWFGEWPLIEPGIVGPADWRPDGPLTPEDEETLPFVWVGVAENRPPQDT
jgi:O-methyltransferase involved in polyketide biosynthesis